MSVLVEHKNTHTETCQLRDQCKRILLGVRNRTQIKDNNVNSKVHVWRKSPSYSFRN